MTTATHMQSPSMTSALTGRRRLPIEDVPDDALDRVLPREAPPARGQLELVSGLCSIYAPGVQPPRFKRLIPHGEGVFGGRYLSGFGGAGRPGIVVYAHADPILERAVTAHEVCHYLRDVHAGDHPGEHDAGFLALCEDVYRMLGIPSATARLIEGQYPRTWRW